MALIQWKFELTMFGSTIRFNIESCKDFEKGLD